MKYAKNGVTVTLFYDARKTNSNGESPIKVRVTFRRKSVYVKTGKFVTPEQWAKLPTGRSNDFLRIRKDIEETFNHVRDVVDEVGVDFTFDLFNARMRRGIQQSLNDLLNAKINALNAEDRVGSAAAYKGALYRIEQFSKKPIMLNDITPDWLRRLERRLLADKTSRTTIAITMRHIRAILNDARRLGLMTEIQYPFGRGKYEIQEGEGRKLALTLEQIGEIARYDDGSEATSKHRDYWLFLYLCNGVNVADFATLKYGDIVGRDICFVRKKTANTTRTRKEIRVVITDKMQEIIDRWGSKPVRADNYIFEYLDGSEDALRQSKKIKFLTKNINNHMGKIGKKLGIGNISTYTARHSFATVLKRAGASIAYISESLGHSDLKTTEHYLASFEREEREKNAELLTRF